MVQYEFGFLLRKVFKLMFFDRMALSMIWFDLIACAPSSKYQFENKPEMISPHPFRKQIGSLNLSNPQTESTVISVSAY